MVNFQDYRAEEYCGGGRGKDEQVGNFAENHRIHQIPAGSSFVHLHISPYAIEVFSSILLGLWTRTSILSRIQSILPPTYTG